MVFYEVIIGHTSALRTKLPANKNRVRCYRTQAYKSSNWELSIYTQYFGATGNIPEFLPTNSYA